MQQGYKLFESPWTKLQVVIITTALIIFFAALCLMSTTIYEKIEIYAIRKGWMPPRLVKQPPP